ETQEWEVCERYLEEALSITANQDLREQISEALGIVRQNAEIDKEIAKRQQIESCLDNLLKEIEGIIKSSISPEEMLRKMSEIAHRRLDPMKQEWGKTSEVFNTASNLLAGGLRNIAIKLHNDAQQYQLALEAISLAFRLCRDLDLRQQIRDEYSRINERS